MSETIATSVRIDLDLKKKLEKMAADDQRSLNNYITLILRKWVEENYKENEPNG